MLSQILPLSVEHLDAVLQLAQQDPLSWSAPAWQSSLVTDQVSGIWAGETLAAIRVVRAGYRETELLYLLVAPAYRRHGWGRSLLLDALSLAEAREDERFLLEVRASNQAAQALYLGLGFVEVGRRRGYYASQSALTGAEDALLMAKDLEPVKTS